MEVAIKQLHDMHFEVHVDSTFDPGAKPLAVLKQVPDTGSTVKTGRIVMITVNSVTPMRVPMPNLISLSFRSAEMLLKNNKMFIGDTTYVPDIARGAVKEQLYKGKPIRPGELIPQGSKIGLVIGNGLGNTDLDVPDLTRMTLDEAMAIVNAHNLIPNVYVGSPSDIITDTPSAFVVSTTPGSTNGAGQPNKIKMGDIIDIQIMQHPDDGDYSSPPRNNKTDTAFKKKPFDPEEDQ